MRRDKWILVSSLLMLGLCALPYGCGGKAVDSSGEIADGSYDGRPRTADGSIVKDGSFTPVGGHVDGTGYSVDGTFVGGDGVAPCYPYVPGSSPFYCGGDGAFPPTQPDGEGPVGWDQYGDGSGDGWDENHGDGENPDGDSTPAEGADMEGAADAWMGCPTC